MTDGTFSLRLVVGLTCSVLLHLLIMFTLVQWPHAGRTPIDHQAITPFHKESSPPRIEVGSPTSNAVTITWIGFDQPTPHSAPQSVIDQPDLSMDPAAGPTTQLAVAAAVTEMNQAVDRAARAAEALREPMTTVARQVTGTVGGLSALVDRMLSEALIEVGQVDAPRTAGSATAQPAPEQPIQPATPAEQQAEPALAATSGGGDIGDAADRASPASAIEKAVRYEPGKPLAARGLEIKTVPPRFSHYTALTARVCDPVLRLSFNANGVMVNHEFLKHACDEDVDRNILDAVYQWRASGEPLRQLRPSSSGSNSPTPGRESESARRPETIEIDVRIVL